MIEIRNGRGEVAELYPDTSISIERNNPLFNDKDDFFEDITYSFKMPASDQNKMFFNWGHLVETPNTEYFIEVQCVVSGYVFYAGSIRFGFIGGDFDVLLLINFGSVAERLKTVFLNELYTADAIAGPFNANFMKTVCENPESYPFSFFPVRNNDWRFDNDQGVVYNTVNVWSDFFQNFTMEPENDGFGYKTPQSAYFKLSYILQKIMQYLGFRTAGTWLDDIENHRIYLYNRIRVPDFLFDSSYYYPEGYTIAEFLKNLRNDPRISLAISFDVFNGVAMMEKASHVITSDQVLDLSGYISNVQEITVDKKNGYTISLKPDAGDALFKDGTSSVATNKIVIGKGENPVELECSTLKEEKIDNERSIPITKQTLNARSGIKQVMRFLYYPGMKTLSNSKVFPQAYPMELKLSDAEWYRFMNDGKKLKLMGDIPVDILHSMKSVGKIGFRTAEGTYQVAVQEKVEYSHTNENSEFVPTTFEARTIVASYDTQVSIAPVSSTDKDGKVGFKAFYKNIAGISEITVDVFFPANTVVFNPGTGTNITIGADLNLKAVLKQSTDDGRGGGHVVYLDLPKVNGLPNNGEVRVSIVPRYLIFEGKKNLFTQHSSGYWFCKPFTSVAYTRDDLNPVWIVF